MENYVVIETAFVAYMSYMLYRAWRDRKEAARMRQEEWENLKYRVQQLRNRKGRPFR